MLSFYIFIAEGRRRRNDASVLSNPSCFLLLSCTPPVYHYYHYLISDITNYSTSDTCSEHRTSAYTFLKVVLMVMVREAEEGQGDDGARVYRRLDWQDSGGVHDNSRRQEGLERTDALFRRLRPSTTTIIIMVYLFWQQKLD